MSTSLNQTQFAPLLKTLYPAEAIKNEVYPKNPFFALVDKDTGFYGDSSKEPVIFATPQNRAAGFSAANNITTTSQARSFLLTRVPNYSMAAISNETMLSSESEKGAFLKALKYEMDNALLALTRAISTQMFRTGTGTIAQIASTATVNSSSVYVALSNPEDIVNLEYGMQLAFSSTDGGAVRATTGCYVVAIDRQAGSFLCSATYGGAPAALTSLVTSPAASDFIYAAATDRNNVISGLRAWLPGTAVTSTPFFGVDRTADKTRLAGVNFDGSALSIEEALISGAARIAREGGTTDTVFMSFLDFSNLVKAVGSKQQYIQYTNVPVKEPKVTVGFNSLLLSGPSGTMNVIPDQNCPAGFAFLLQMNTWKLKSLGEAVRIFNGDGLTMLRDPSGDNLLIRCFSYSQLSCRAPGWNGVVTLP